MKIQRLALCVMCFLITPKLQAHLPGEHVFIPMKTVFVQTKTHMLYLNTMPIGTTPPLAKYYAGVQHKSTVFSKPLKLRFQLGKLFQVHLSYN